MDVDGSPVATGAQISDGKSKEQPNSKQMQEKIIKMHPLALIGISDHSTRVISGGTAQPTNSVIMGLLFGVQNHLTISIIDAEEVEYNHNKEHVDTKISLHQKVFPAHEVVGWYRVFRSDGTTGEDREMGLPTPEDMAINNGWMKEYNESPLFVLMSSGEKEEEERIAAEAEAARKENDGGTDMDVDGDPDEREARDKMDRDEQLPLSIYETLLIAEQTARSAAIFVNLEFELETFEPERIAVEEVFKTQPTTAGSVLPTTSALSTPPADADDPPKMGPPLPPKIENDTPSPSKPNQHDEDAAADALHHPPPPSASTLHIRSLQSSIEAMNARIAVLLEFLRKTQSGRIPPDHALLRQVGSLVRQLPFVTGRGDFAVEGSRTMRDGRVAGEFEDGYDDMLVMAFLASVAKTTKAVLSYSDKFRVTNDQQKNSRDGLGLRKIL